jgi:transporter family protein
MIPLWVIYPIFATMLFAILNILDKFVLSKWVKNALVPVLVAGIIELLSVFLIFLFHGFSFLSLTNIAWAFVAGIFYVVTLVSYYKAAQIEEISRVAPLYNIAPLFTLILAAIFLGEIFSPFKYLGILLLISGAIMISLRSLKIIKLNNAFWLMLLAALSIGVGNVIIKYLLSYADFWTIFGYERLGEIFALLPIIYVSFPDLFATVKKYGMKTVGLMSIGAAVNLIGLLLVTIATSVGYVTLVSALSGVQPFFVLLFAIILSVFFPRILKEEVGKSVIAIKILAIILIFVGVLMIT